MPQLGAAPGAWCCTLCKVPCMVYGSAPSAWCCVRCMVHGAALTAWCYTWCMLLCMVHGSVPSAGCCAQCMVLHLVHGSMHSAWCCAQCMVLCPNAWCCAPVHGAAELATARKRGERGEARQRASIVHSGQTNAGDSAGSRFPSRARHSPAGAQIWGWGGCTAQQMGTHSPCSRSWCCHAARSTWRAKGPGLTPLPWQ